MISSKVKRVTAGTLPARFGPDKNRRLVVSFIPGDGKPAPNGIPDVLELRPLRTRRSEKIAVLDVYQYALRCRVNSELLAKARESKIKKATRLAYLRQLRAEKRLRERARRDCQLNQNRRTEGMRNYENL